MNELKNIIDGILIYLKYKTNKMNKNKKTDPRINQAMYNDKQYGDDCIICDLDGTLSLMNDRSPYDGHLCETDKINPSVKQLLQIYYEQGIKILLFSGRNSDNNAYSNTVNWLKNHSIDYDVLEMRKPKDYRKDTIIKQEMFDKHVKGKYNVLFVLDDRNMMVDHWREMGLDCFQVYYGNF